MNKSKFKILIVEDEPVVLEILSEGFKAQGHRVLVASSGNEAIEILRKEKLDIVLSDLKMPNGNGMDVLNFVKTMKPLPIFFFLTGQSEYTAAECIAAGARNYFPKPFDIKKLISQIENEFKMESMGLKLSCIE
jgi:CheY-like chemotaxis protein